MQSTLSTTRWLRNAAFAAFMVLLLLGTSGCGKKVEYLEEIAFLPVKEKLEEFPLGGFTIPVPVRASPDAPDWVHGNSVQLSFELYAVLSPKNIKSLTKTWERNERKFRSEVLQECRVSSQSELSEPALTSIKGRLTELALRRFSTSHIRRLVVTKIKLESL